MLAIARVTARLDKIDALQTEILRETEGLREDIHDEIMRDPATHIFEGQWRNTSLDELRDLQELVRAVRTLLQPIRRAYHSHKSFLLWTEMDREKRA